MSIDRFKYVLGDRVWRFPDFVLGRLGQQGLTDQAVLPVGQYLNRAAIQPEEDDLRNGIPTFKAFSVQKDKVVWHHIV